MTKTATKTNNLELKDLIARLTSLTNQEKIYGGTRILARCDAEKTAECVFNLLNSSLTAIHALTNEIETLKFERSCTAEQLKIQDELTAKAGKSFTEFLLKRASGRLPLPLTDLSKR